MNYSYIIISVYVILAIIAFALHIKTRQSVIKSLKNSGKNLNDEYSKDQKKYRCPNCGQLSISAEEKKNLKSSLYITCPHCGQHLTTPWWTKFAMVMITFFLFVLGLIFFGISYFLVLLLIPGAYAAMFFKMRYVPLIKKYS